MKFFNDNIIFYSILINAPVSLMKITTQKSNATADDPVIRRSVKRHVLALNSPDVKIRLRKYQCESKLYSFLLLRFVCIVCIHSERSVLNHSIEETALIAQHCAL